MVQKISMSSEETPRRRGRPRAYDPDVALERAMEVFWKVGFAAASLDDLAAAMRMNRPSLYAAFGDKKALYTKALDHYRIASRDAVGDAFTRDLPLRDRLRLIFLRVLDLYTSGETARGCFSVVTAASDVVADPDIRDLVVRSIDGLDKTFATLFAKGVADGELPADANVPQLAMLATATLHTMSVRARAGLSRKKLQSVIDASVATICG